MMKLTSAALVMLSNAKLGSAAAPSSSFVANINISTTKKTCCPYSHNSRRYSAVLSNEFAECNEDPGKFPSFSPATSRMLDIPEDDQEEIDALLAKKEKRRAARLQRACEPNYQITLPITSSLVQPPQVTISADGTHNRASESLALLVAKGQEIAAVNTVGMSLRQVYSGRRLSELALDVDTLRFQTFADEIQGRRIDGEDDAATAASGLAWDEDSMKSNNDQLPFLGTIQVLQNHALEMLKESFEGVIVSSVAHGGMSWTAGVRAGDVLTATSATVGSKLWPKSTLDGVRSAISSRKVMTSTMDFEFCRLSAQTGAGGGSAEVVKSFELALSRPIGINVEDMDDGYVTIVGISDKSPPIVKDNLRVGDRVVSVESSVGANMWDVFSTDGLMSAVTSRLPGQPVRIIFERTEAVEKVAPFTKKPAATATSSISDAVVGFRQAGQSVAAPLSSASTAASTQQTATPTAAQKVLLSRSRDLLRTYIARNEVTKNVKVADRVLDAVIDASAILDGKTLALIMKAYIACSNPEKAIQLFEDVFGLAGDGSEKEVKRTHGGKLAADMSALNIFTVSMLLRAHAVRGDYESACLVLAAVEGNTEFSINGRRPRSWLGKGDPLNMLPDSRCYNIALAAAAKMGTKEGLRAAGDIFDSMPDPSLTNPPISKPAKNLVTFNTMINAFANAGKYQEAYGVFQSLKKSVLHPDRVTYTTLIKASIRSGDTEKALDLLDDMKWIGIQPDIVSYNNIIESLCKANRLYEAKDLVNDMEIEKVTPDSMTYGLLMKGLLRVNKPGPCLTLFESACADQRTTAVTENVQLYTTAISAAAALGNCERALDLLLQMNRVGIRPNKKTLTALMGACISGRKYHLAVDIFSKIKNPDGHAISVGLGALCLGGNFDDALELITQHQSRKVLTGKQVMSGYNKLIQASLYSSEYTMARNALSCLLRAGYIPSKATFQAMIDGLHLQSDMLYTLASGNRWKKSMSSNGKFEFLLFVLDSLEDRKLTISSEFYSSILVSAVQAGGLQKRIASLLIWSRKNGAEKEITLSGVEALKKEQYITSWEHLLKNYSHYKKEELGLSVRLPSVQVSSKDFGRVLAAEQAVQYRYRAV